ncbi:uncharacterized protein IWZ02DRAFT_487015 [Phyllosticta citriasiana]|uniref:Uncharacterized protein n=1 Tax=Phyllosticta citriasiana TaxID=595635 RepID=A0ABR1KDJ0_9PEZI
MAYFGAFNARLWSELNLVLNFAEDVTLDDDVRHHAVKWVTCALGAIATPPQVSISSNNAYVILVRISLDENTPTEWKQTFQHAMRISWSLIGEGVSVLNGEELNLMLKYIEDDEDVDIELRLSMLKLVIIDLEEARSPSGYAAYPPTLLTKAFNTNKIVKELFLSDDTPNKWKQIYIRTMRAERILVTQGIHLFSGKWPNRIPSAYSRVPS